MQSSVTESKTFATKSLPISLNISINKYKSRSYIKTLCFWWWNQLFHTLEHPVNHIGYLHEIVRRENYFIRFYVTEKGDTFFICHSIHHRFNTLYNKSIEKSYDSVTDIFQKTYSKKTVAILPNSLLPHAIYNNFL